MSEADARNCLKLWDALMETGHIDTDEYPEIGIDASTSDFERWHIVLGWDDGTEHDIFVTFEEFDEGVRGYIREEAAHD